MRKALLFGLFFSLLSCHRAPLEVDFVYVGGRSLASYWVCTPDPKLCDPPTGQKLVMLWRFSKAEWEALVNPKLQLKVRFSNREEKTLWWDITTNRGKAIYVHVGTCDNPCPGINTYRAEIVSEGKVAYVVEQALWTDWIALQGATLCPIQAEICEVAEESEELTGYSWNDLEEIDYQKENDEPIR